MAEEEEQVDVAEEEEEEEDVVDPIDEIREKCSEVSKCRKLNEILEECTNRVNGKSNTTETCTQELFDFLHCRDDCVSKTLFKHLK
ncbi:cytochrome b-c1 complex subunit 6, mitochondrial-like [Dysidea avara]|uniref:cytochrome b-c1 complex subunit 6, mitochondrial-like n=1 Tax=Dysidea avara TaxID=196820 RepID=UPI003322C975